MGDFGGLARPSKRRKVVGAVGDNTRGGMEETSMNGHATITNDMASVTRREKGVRFEVEGWNGWNGHAAENGAEGEDGRSDQGGGDEEGEPHRDNKHEPEPSPKSSGRSLRSSTRLRKPPTRYAEVEPIEKPKRSLRTRRKVGEVLGQAQGEGEVESVGEWRMELGLGAGVGTGSRPDPNVHAGRISREGNGRPAVQNRESNGDEVWEVPSDDDDDDDDDGDQLQDGVTDGLELDPAVEQGDDGEEAVEGEDEVEADHDMSALQLQQELVDNDTPVAEPEELPPYAYEFKKLCEESELEGHVGSLATFILKKLTGKHPIPLRCLDSQYQTVHQLVEQTVVAGEGNSLLLLGSRGCGKTAVVEAVISSLANNHRDDFHVVRLNGFLHTDDRIALREIWRQLGREMNTEDETSKTISYADTMASLLGLLSHPEELFGVSEDPNAIATAKSVIIILDEFDLFAYHPRQTLLYNLFDIAQARKAPLAVLGLTTKVDVTENLEKRVKSRFSHRYVFLPRPRSFSEFSEICKAGIALSEEELPMVGLDDLKNRGGKLLLDGWNEYIQNLPPNQVPQGFLHQRTPPNLNSLPQYTTTIQHQRTESPTPDPKILLFPPSLLPRPRSPPLPPATSSTSNTSLPLSLLLAATRLTALHDPGLNATQPQAPTPLTLSFPAAYAEYVRLLTSAKTSASAAGAAATPGRVWGKDVAREAWERLVNWGLVVPVGGGSGMGDGRMFRIEISFEEVLDGVGDSGVGALGRWWREV
ncbi:origin recognition complex subunit Orc4 [Blastomyces dermatitidis ATCC 18188]|uniref:Origin recognition complex subunit 4 n=1 Tax=Ajellomyces dermatitidis (strain ATCC 18188 / CBS 674.68) TaxID=653446 RepID=F2TGS3_AJEDA|nr:origin recognition complex subunit Orc4 [Blastomyces dermatitidis ATCC 18188]